MQTQTNEPGRNFAERILAEMATLRADMQTTKKEIRILNECATLLVRPMHEDDESPLEAIMRLLGLLVTGTEETHKRLEAMNAALFDSRMGSALRATMLDV